MSVLHSPSLSSPASPPASDLARDNGPPQGWRTSALRALPRVAVLCLLASVMYLGHLHHWKLPKFSALMGAAAPQSDWCAEHSVPDSICIECKPDLHPPQTDMGFCREHGVAQCVLHHPQLAQVKGDPKPPRYDTLAAIGLMPRPANNSRDELYKRRVQFASPESIAKAGVDVDVVMERPMTESISAPGEFSFDPTQVAHLSSRVPGTVAAVYRTMGEAVRAGEVLALVDSAQVGQAKAQMLQAVVQTRLQRTTVERLRGATGGGSIPQRSLTDADAALQEATVALLSARQTLQNLGFDPPDDLEQHTVSQIADELRHVGIPPELQSTIDTPTANLIPIRAPSEGVIVASDIVSGEVVDASRLLFTIANPRRLWLMLQVRQEEAPFVQIGQEVQFTTDDGYRQVTGKLSWISPSIDEQTRTLGARVVVDNDDGALRDKTYGSGRIILRVEPYALTVPRDAVQSTLDAHFIFVRDSQFFDESSPKFFHVRQVRLGARDDERIELLAGAIPGEVVATRGSSALLAQLLRAGFGASCGCHE